MKERSFNNQGDENQLRRKAEDIILNDIDPDTERKLVRETAKVLSGIAIDKGATISPLETCGLDVVLAAVFGEEIDLARKESDGENL